MASTALLQRIRGRLESAFAERLRGVVLFGSEARGTTGPDSAVDMLVLLDGPVHAGRDLMTALDALYPLALDLGRPMSPKPVDAREYETLDCPLYRGARSEGVAG